MVYQCKCGNSEEFLEVFETAVDVVDGSAKFVKTESRNVAYYICRECECEIPYTEFFPIAAAVSAN
jgi:hypothetical protein